MFIYFPLFSLFIFSISNCLLLESDKSIEFHDSKNVESCAVGVPHWIVSSCFAQPLSEVSRSPKRWWITWMHDFSLCLSLYMYMQDTGSEEQAHKTIMILYTVYIYMTYHQLSTNLRWHQKQHQWWLSSSLELWDMIYDICGSLMPRFKRGCGFVTSNVYHFGPRLWWLRMAGAGPSLLILFLTCSVSNLFEHQQEHVWTRRGFEIEDLLPILALYLPDRNGAIYPKTCVQMLKNDRDQFLDRVSFQNHLTIAVNRNIKFINLSAIFIHFRDGL
jgi:hypothetical protein